MLLDAVKILINVQWIFTEIFIMRRTSLLLKLCSKNKPHAGSPAPAPAPAELDAAQPGSISPVDGVEAAGLKAEIVRANNDLERLRLVNRRQTGA